MNTTKFQPRAAACVGFEPGALLSLFTREIRNVRRCLRLLVPEEVRLGLTRGVERGIIFALYESMLFNTTRMSHLKPRCPWPLALESFVCYVCFGKHWFKSSLKVSLILRNTLELQNASRASSQASSTSPQGSAQTDWISHSESLFQRWIPGPTKSESLDWGPQDLPL